MGRYLAIDYGEKRVGIAISDPTATIATPLKTINFSSHKQLLSEIKKISDEYAIKKIVLGLPITMKGTDSEKTREVRQFSEKLTKHLNKPVSLLDERMTTVQAHLTMRQMGKQPSRNRKTVDQLAAQNILQTYLERERNWKLKNE